MVEIKFPLKTEENISKIKKWWKAFGDKEAEINAFFSQKGAPNVDIPKFMHSTLNKVHNGICWEFGPGLTKPHRLVIAAEANHEIESLVDLVVKMAPQFEYFDIVLNRPATPWSELVECGPDSRFTWKSPRGVLVSVEQGPHNLIDLMLYVPESIADENLNRNCFLLAESLIGETLFQNWVGAFEAEVLQKKRLFSKTPPVPQNAIPAASLHQAVINLTEEIHRKLPDVPYYESVDDKEWSICKIERPASKDYARMDDVFIATTADTHILQAQTNPNSRFSSERFSSHKETFIFVKIDAEANNLDLTVVDQRYDIQDALDEALRGKELGAVNGGATGRKYAYVMLTVINLDEALDVILSTLRLRKMSPQTWILFSDLHRQMEWVGLWDDSSEPVLPNYEESVFQ